MRGTRANCIHCGRELGVKETRGRLNFFLSTWQPEIAYGAEFLVEKRDRFASGSLCTGCALELSQLVNGWIAEGKTEVGE